MRHFYPSGLLKRLDRHLDYCIGFNDQRKHLRKVPLQQKG